MAHLSEGMLRRLYDEPNAVSDPDRDHYNGCDRCRERFAAIAEDARTAQFLMAVPAVTVDPAAALRAVRRRTAEAPQRRRILARLRLPNLGAGRRWMPATAGLLALLVVSFALVGAGYAQEFLQIFTPKATAPVLVSSGDVNTQLLPDLSTYGDVKVQKNPELAQADSAAAAAKATGLPIITVGPLPSGVPSKATYATVTQGSASFTFSYSKARAAAEAKGKSVPPMPKNIDGSTIQVAGGPGYAIVYGYDQIAAQAQAGHGPEAPPASGTKPAGDAAKPAAGQAPSLANVPPLLGVAAAKAPVVSTSSGVTAKQLEDYLLSQPGISPSLAAQIRAIGDPASTLPIPVPAGYATSQQVKVQGVTGTALGDNTGLGAGVIWIKNGVVFAVVGTLTQQQAIDAANGLKIS